MPYVEVTVTIPRDADSLWREIGSFQGVGDWHPLLARVDGEGEQPGALRTAETGEGQQQVERLQATEPRAYRYAMESTPLPVTDYVANLRVQGAGADTSRVVWIARRR